MGLILAIFLMNPHAGLTVHPRTQALGPWVVATAGFLILADQVASLVPQLRLYRKVKKSVKDLFGYVPGEKEEEKGPLEFLGDGSYELPGAGK